MLLGQRGNIRIKSTTALCGSQKASGTYFGNIGDTADQALVGRLRCWRGREREIIILEKNLLELDGSGIFFYIE